MTLIAYYFRNYRHVFRQISKRPRLGIPFNSQHVKGSQTLPKYARQNIYLFFFHSEGIELENVCLSDI